MKDLLFNYKNIKTLAGTDEAGRGCLAGPVVAAAVILKKPILGLNDSKVLKKSERIKLREIIEQEAIAFAVAFISPKVIDDINILNASILAMQNAVFQLKVMPAMLLVDGNRFKTIEGIAHQTIIKGDSIYQCIAAASILAKTYRDEYMDEMHLEYPNYGWNTNAGYPTKKHREGITQYGITHLHRKTFRLLPNPVKLL